jgi:hypothetical protein
MTTRMDAINRLMAEGHVARVLLIPAAADPGREGSRGPAARHHVTLVEPHHIAARRAEAAIAGVRAIRSAALDVRPLIGSDHTFHCSEQTQSIPIASAQLASPLRRIHWIRDRR